LGSKRNEQIDEVGLCLPDFVQASSSSNPSSFFAAMTTPKAEKPVAHRQPDRAAKDKEIELVHQKLVDQF